MHHIMQYNTESKVDTLKNKLTCLVNVKSIVTIMLTVVFSYITVKGKISSDQFLVIFSTVMAFYFGTQHEKKNID